MVEEIDLLRRAKGDRLGCVSTMVPLISNLAVWENIALIVQYHEKLSRDKAYRLALGRLERLGIQFLAQVRPANLGSRERFLVMLLRATMVGEAAVMIERPFQLLPELKDISFLYATLAKIEDFYHECYIFDLAVLKSRYEINDAKEHGI